MRRMESKQQLPFHPLLYTQKCEPIIYKLHHLGLWLNDFISQTLVSC